MPRRVIDDDSDSSPAATISVHFLGEQTHFEDVPIRLRYGETSLLDVYTERTLHFPDDARLLFELANALFNSSPWLTLLDTSGRAPRFFWWSDKCCM